MEKNRCIPAMIIACMLLIFFILFSVNVKDIILSGFGHIIFFRVVSIILLVIVISLNLISIFLYVAILNLRL